MSALRTSAPFPYNGIIVAHSNEAEVATIQEQPATTKRFSIGSASSRCPTACAPARNRRSTTSCLRDSALREAQCAPETLDIMARFSVLTRLHDHENSTLLSKMRIYDGETLKDTDPKAKSLQEYRDVGGRRRGHERHLHPLCLQGAVGDVQSRH